MRLLVEEMTAGLNWESMGLAGGNCCRISLRSQEGDAAVGRRASVELWTWREEDMEIDLIRLSIGVVIREAREKWWCRARVGGAGGGDGGGMAGGRESEGEWEKQ